MRLAVPLAALALLVSPAAAEPFHHPYGEWRAYSHDWLAACPDEIDEAAADYYGYSCFASTGSELLNSARLPAYKITLIRNRLTGELDVAITIAADDLAYDEARPLQLVFAGEPPVSLVEGHQIETRFDTTNQYFVSAPDLRDRIIERLQERAAVTLVVPLSGTPLPVEVPLSLQGVMGALDFMATYARRIEQY